MFADELQKSFMPVFVKEVGTGLTFLPLDVLLGLPIMAFMAMIAILPPWLAVGQTCMEVKKYTCLV